MKVVIAALTLALAAPAVAQMSPPPPGEMMPDGPGRIHMGNPMFAGMSDAGRALMRGAMHAADPRDGRAIIDAARDRMLTILDAERLDVAALRRAMDDERAAANASKVRHQAAMIAGFQQLSPQDRHAFVVNARAMRQRMDDKVARWQRRGPGGPGGPGPIMPPPQ